MRFSKFLGTVPFTGSVSGNRSPDAIGIESGLSPHIRRVSVVLLLLLAGTFSPAQDAPRQSLRRSIDAVLADERLAKVRMSVRVIDCANGKTLYSFKAKENLPPASNVKLFVTAAAVELLGSGFEYVTVIRRDGPLKAGVLDGNLVLQGSGDPNFSGRFYDGDVNHVPRGWAREIARAGVTKITGDLVCDDSLFDRQLVNPFWTERDQRHWYAPQVSALSFNDNCLDLYISPGKNLADSARLSTKPKTRYVTLVNTCKTVKHRRANPAVWRKSGGNRISVAGSVYHKSGTGRHWIPIHQPALYLGTVFAEELERAGVKLVGKVRLIGRACPRTSADDERTLVVFRSGIRRTIAVTNKRSQALYAESLAKLLGARFGRSGSFAEGLAVVNRFLTDTVGLPAGSVKLVDGSGLADQNRCSAFDITELLRMMNRGSNAGVFMDSLSVAGIDGTLRRRFKQAPYRGNIIGKTGRIAGVRTLSGYVRTRSGRVLAFSMLAASVRNEAAVDAAHNHICRLLYEQ